MANDRADSLPAATAPAASPAGDCPPIAEVTVPEQSRAAMQGVVPGLSLSDATAAVDFYGRAFDARELNRVPAPDGKRILHCHLAINGGSIMINDAFPEFGCPLQAPQGYALHLQVDDVDAWWDRAVGAGAVVEMPLQLMFWGDRYGRLRDPFGVVWSLGAQQR